MAFETPSSARVTAGFFLIVRSGKLNRRIVEKKFPSIIKKCAK
jgi:hypothetical protein